MFKPVLPNKVPQVHVPVEPLKYSDAWLRRTISIKHILDFEDLVLKKNRKYPITLLILITC